MCIKRKAGAEGECLPALFRQAVAREGHDLVRAVLDDDPLLHFVAHRSARGLVSTCASAYASACNIACPSACPCAPSTCVRARACALARACMVLHLACAPRGGMKRRARLDGLCLWRTRPRGSEWMLGACACLRLATESCVRRVLTTRRVTARAMARIHASRSVMGEGGWCVRAPQRRADREF